MVQKWFEEKGNAQLKFYQCFLQIALDVIRDAQQVCDAFLCKRDTDCVHDFAKTTV